MRATQARIHLSHIEHNLHLIQDIAPRAKLCVAVKANAYGHGAVEVSKTAVKAGASFLAVAAVLEGAELRSNGIDAPILLLGPSLPEETCDIIHWKLSPLVFDKTAIDLLEKAAIRANIQKLPVHLKIDTGMGRIGCRASEAPEIAAYIKSKKHLKIEGTCTHFSVSDSFNPDDITYTEKQISLFTESVQKIRQLGINPGIVHAASSSAILKYPHAYFDMVRPGILTYGYYPSKSFAQHFGTTSTAAHIGHLNFRPVMELVTHITQIKTVDAGSFISYGRKWQSHSTSNIATASIGYGDGLLRKLSPGIMFTIRGKKYPVAGAICMDQCMLHVDSAVNCWDTATVFGPDPDCNGADDVAEFLDTIPYEVLCLVSARVPRVYMGLQK